MLRDHVASMRVREFVTPRVHAMLANAYSTPSDAP